MRHLTSGSKQFQFSMFALAAVCSLSAIAASAQLPSKPSKSADASKTREFKYEEIPLRIPTTWNHLPNTSKLNKLEFEIAPVKGDSEPAHFYMSFVFQSQGPTEQMMNEWIEGYLPKGRKAKVSEGTFAKGKYTIVDVAGTLNRKGDSADEPPKAIPGRHLIAVVLTVEDDLRYFLTLSGPDKTVTAAAKAFRESFGGDVKKEKELKQSAATK